MNLFEIYGNFQRVSEVLCRDSLRPLAPHLAFLNHQVRCFASLFPIPVFKRYSSFTLTPPFSLSVLTSAPATQGICLWSHLASLWKPQSWLPWPWLPAAHSVHKRKAAFCVLFCFVFSLSSRNQQSPRNSLESWDLMINKNWRQVKFFFKFLYPVCKTTICLPFILIAEIIRKSGWAQRQCSVSTASLQCVLRAYRAHPGLHSYTFFLRTWSCTWI